MTPTERETYLREPHIANLGTVRPDGSPHVTPVWHHYDGENVVVLAESTSVKVRNIRREPRVFVSIATDANPYRYVLVDGVATLSTDRIREYCLAMACNYLGDDRGPEYTDRVVPETDFVVITIHPKKIIDWVSEE